MIWLLWSIIVGWIVISVAFYSFSAFCGWQWTENFQRDRREESSSGEERRRSHTSTNWSFAPGQSSVTSRKTTTTTTTSPTSKAVINTKVRDHLEQLIAKELGGSPPEVSATATNPNILNNCEKYDKFRQAYHDKLTKTIVDLGKSLHLRSYNHSDNDGVGQPAVETAHDNFCKLLKEVKVAVMDLAPFEDEETTVISNNNVILTSSMPGLLTNYEEILSNAILNKVVSDVGLGGSRKSLSPVISVVDSAICKDVKSWVTTTDDFSNFSDDDLSLGTSSWSGGAGDGAAEGTQAPPVVHQIEEHVEITYETNETYSDTSHDDEEDEEEEENDDNESPSRRERPRKPKKKTKQEPVPFPEHGVDMIDSPDEQDEDEPSKKVSQVGAWEQNWLFKRKKKPILFSKMAAEAVPMLVPNPSPTTDDKDGDTLNGNNEEEEAHNVDAGGEDSDKLSELEDEDFVVEFFELKNPQTNPPPPATTTTAAAPLAAATTQQQPPPPAKITTTKKDGEEVVVVVNKEDEKKKDENIVIIKNKTVDNNSIKRPQQDVSLTATGKTPKLSANNNNNKFNVQSSERKKCTPTFTAIPKVVHVSKNEDPIHVNFELSGHPEPVVNIFKGNDILTSIEDRGQGKWTLVLKRDGSKISISGEYVAVATNTQGTTRGIFKIEEDQVADRPNLVSPEDSFPSISAESQGDEDDNRSSSSSSPAEETLKETSQSMVTNETRELQEEDHTKRFTVAEREKMKWANPIKLDFNPYAPENLAKRIRSIRGHENTIPLRENSKDLDLVGDNNNKGSSPEPDDDDDNFLKTDKRDIKKMKEPKMNVMSKSPIRLLPSDLGEVKLPSVKERIQQFSPVQTDKSPSEHSKPMSPQKDVVRGIQYRRSFSPQPNDSVRASSPISSSLVGDASRNLRGSQSFTNAKVDLPYMTKKSPPAKEPTQVDSTTSSSPVPAPAPALVQEKPTQVASTTSPSPAPAPALVQEKQPAAVVEMPKESSAPSRPITLAFQQQEQAPVDQNVSSPVMKVPPPTPEQRKLERLASLTFSSPVPYTSEEKKVETTNDQVKVPPPLPKTPPPPKRSSSSASDDTPFLLIGDKEVDTATTTATTADDDDHPVLAQPKSTEDNDLSEVTESQSESKSECEFSEENDDNDDDDEHDFVMISDQSGGDGDENEEQPVLLEDKNSNESSSDQNEITSLHSLQSENDSEENEKDQQQQQQQQSLPDDHDNENDEDAENKEAAIDVTTTATKIIEEKVPVVPTRTEERKVVPTKTEEEKAREAEKAAEREKALNDARELRRLTRKTVQAARSSKGGLLLAGQDEGATSSQPNDS